MDTTWDSTADRSCARWRHKMDTALAMVGVVLATATLKCKGDVNMWFLFSVVFSGISISFRKTVCCVECFWWLIPAFWASAENLCQSQFYQRTLNLNQGCPHPVLRLGISVQPGCPIFHLGAQWGLDTPAGTIWARKKMPWKWTIYTDIQETVQSQPRKHFFFNFYTCNKMWLIQLLDEKRRRRWGSWLQRVRPLLETLGTRCSALIQLGSAYVITETLSTLFRQSGQQGFGACGPYSQQRAGML